MNRAGIEHRIGARVLEAVAFYQRHGIKGIGATARSMLDDLHDLGLDTGEIERVARETEPAVDASTLAFLDRALHPDGKCSCAGDGCCRWCLRSRFNTLIEDVATVADVVLRTNDADAIAAIRRIDVAIDSLLVDIAGTLAIDEHLRESLTSAEAERDRWTARVKLVENRIDTAIGILRGTALAAVEVFADAGCTADEIDDAIAFLDPNGNAGDVEPGDVSNHGYRVPIALAKIATALRRRGQ